jgi:hypothetical protein
MQKKNKKLIASQTIRLERVNDIWRLQVVYYQKFERDCLKYYKRMKLIKYCDRPKIIPVRSRKMRQVLKGVQ